MTGLETAPVLIAINEAKEYDLWGEAYGLAAAEELSRTLHRPYDMRLLPSKGDRLPSHGPLRSWTK